MKKKFFVASLLIISSIFINATIQEIYDINELTKCITPNQNMHVFVDFDNTLICMDGIGSDHWFEKYVAHIHQQNPECTTQKAIEIALPHYIKLQNELSIRTVQFETAKCIQYLIHRGINITGLTVRSKQLADRTHEFLRQTNITLAALTEHEPHELVIPNGNNCLYDRNAIFTEGGCKWQAIAAYYQHHKKDLPEKIALIDDKEKYLIACEQGCKKAGIEFLGLRYGFMDETVKNFKFDPTIHAPK